MHARATVVLKIGEGSITLEGSSPWEEKDFVKEKGSTIPEGSEEGDGSAAEGQNIAEGPKEEESFAITGGSGKRQSSAAVDLEGLEKR